MITTTKRLIGTGCFAALSFVISLIEFPIFPAADFLKLDFSSVFILLAGFIFGPISAVCVSGVKELLRFLMGSATGGVGEIANFCIVFGFFIIPTLVYKYRKGFSTVVLTILIGCLIQIALSLLVNRYINFPLYMGESAQVVFNALWGYIVAFNAIKAVSVSIITIILYKRVSGFIKSVTLKKPNKKG